MIHRIQILSKQTHDLIDLDLLTLIDPTHVIVGIEWGDDVICSVEDMNHANDDINKVEGNLQLSLEMAATVVSGEIRNNSRHYNIQLFSDILPLDNPFLNWLK